MISNPFTTYLYFWGWRDLIELLFFIIVLYKVTYWLNKDKTRHLVAYIYCYCFLLLGAHYLHLSVVWSFLLMYGPVLVIICILMHQEILQKHLAAPIKIIPAQVSNYWLDDLMQAFLSTMNAQHPILCVIQHKNDLGNLLQTSYPLNTPVQKNVLLALFESKHFNHQAPIHINYSGTLLGINCHWINNSTTISNDQAQEAWKTATAIIAKNDALVLRGNPTQNTFDIALHGSIIEQVSSPNCRKIIHQFLHTTQDKKNQTKDTSHETHHT